MKEKSEENLDPDNLAAEENEKKNLFLARESENDFSMSATHERAQEENVRKFLRRRFSSFALHSPTFHWLPHVWISDRSQCTFDYLTQICPIKYALKQLLNICANKIRK